MSKVSVVLPVYNGEPFLPATLASLFSQSLPPTEILAVDDGSADRSLEILSSCRQTNLRLVKQSHQGLASALNHGIQLAQSPLIAIANEDDLNDPSRLEQQVHFLKQHPEVVLVGGAIAQMDEEGRLLQAYRDFPATHAGIVGGLNQAKWVMAHPTWMFRRSAAMEIGLYQDCYAEDLDFLKRIATKGEVANLPQVLVRYRIRRNAISTLHQRQHRTAARRIATAGNASIEPVDRGLRRSHREREGVYQARVARALLDGGRYIRGVWHAGIAVALLATSGYLWGRRHPARKPRV